MPRIEIPGSGGGGGGTTEFATDEVGNLGATHTTTFGTENFRVVTGTLNANHVETIAGRAAGKVGLLRFVQDATGSRTLSISDGTTPTSVTVNSTASAPTDILVICPNSTDIDIVVLGGASAETDPNAVLKSLGTTKGDIVIFTASATPARQAVPSNGQAWVGDSSQTNGVTTGMPYVVTANAQTGTSYTLVLGDAGKLVTVSNASTHTLTVPLNASVAYPTGTVINVARLGAGAVNVAATGGVTINSPGSVLGLRAQYSQATLVKTGTDTWLLGGDIA